MKSMPKTSYRGMNSNSKICKTPFFKSKAENKKSNSRKADSKSKVDWLYSACGIDFKFYFPIRMFRLLIKSCYYDLIVESTLRQCLQ